MFLIQWKVKHLVRIIRFRNGLVGLQSDQNGAAVDMEDDLYISRSDICVFLRMDEIMDLIIFGFKMQPICFDFFLINAEQLNIRQAIQMC